MRKKTYLFGLLILSSLMFSACSSPPLDLTPTSEERIEQAEPTQPLPTETPILEPTSTPEPAAPFQSIDHRLTMVAGHYSWESTFADPGAVIYHNGLFHMFYNGIDCWPCDVNIGYATSEDGIHWKRQADEPVLTGLPENIDWIDTSLFLSSGYVSEDGTWVLYFYTVGTDESHSASYIGRAAADSPFGPFIADPEPVLLPGLDGSWNSHAVAHPYVIKFEEGYRMYFDGAVGDLDGVEGRAIGLATSEDGIHWVKMDDPNTSEPLFAESDPIFFPNSLGGKWDSLRVADPSVVFTKDGWVMVYLSFGPTPNGECRTYMMGYAFSDDGIHWERGADEPFISSVQYDWLGIYLMSSVSDGENIYVYYDVQAPNANGTNIYLNMQAGPLK